MDIDFSLVLVSLVAACGALWLVDIALFRRPRLALIAEFKRGKGAGLADAERDRAVAELAREPLLIEYAKSFFPVLVIVLVLRSFLVEPFQIPTGSMIPTLKVGDFILVNKYAYGIRLPVIGTKIIDVGEPQRGEVMVFFPPHEPKYYVKRVVGLPGDTVRYEEKTLYINGEEVPKQYVEDIGIDVVMVCVPKQLGGSG
ncbi:MAG: signal peptidase I [Gammaproteobacteria bacterium]